MMSYKYLDPADVGKIELPTEEQLAREEWTGGYERENNGYWRGGLSTDNPKEYQRLWYQKNKEKYKSGGKYDWYGKISDEERTEYIKKKTKYRIDNPEVNRKACLKYQAKLRMEKKNVIFEECNKGNW